MGHGSEHAKPRAHAATAYIALQNKSIAAARRERVPRPAQRAHAQLMAAWAPWVCVAGGGGGGSPVVPVSVLIISAASTSPLATEVRDPETGGWREPATGGQSEVSIKKGWGIS